MKHLLVDPDPRVDVTRALRAIAYAAMLCLLALELQAAATMSAVSAPAIEGSYELGIVPPGADGTAAGERQAIQSNDGEPCMQQARAVYIAATKASAGDACAKRFISKVPMFNAPPRYDLIVMRI